MFMMARAEVREIQFDNIGEQSVQLQTFKTQGWSVLENYFKDDKPCSRIIKYTNITVPLNVKMALTDSTAKNKDITTVSIRSSGSIVFEGNISELLERTTLFAERLLKRRVNSVKVSDTTLIIQLDLTSGD